MPVRQVDVLEVLFNSSIPLSVNDIVGKLNLNESIESTLKTTPKKRVSTCLRYLEKKGHVASYKFHEKDEIVYRHKGEMIKDLIVHVMVSNLHPFYKTEFMELVSPALTDEKREIIGKEIEVYKAYLKEKGPNEKSLEEVRDKVIRINYYNEKKNEYFT